MFVLILIVVAAILLWWNSTKNHDYWAKKNVKHDKPLPFFGNHLPNLLLKRNRPDIGVELYNKFRGEKIVGYYRGIHPELYIMDPGIMKRIFTTDFESFPGRGSLGSREKDPLLHNVIFIAGEEWRAARQMLTPAFSPGKLRGMFPLLLLCVEKLQEVLQQMVATQKEIKTHSLMTRLPLQFVASCGFGVEIDTLSADNSFADLAKSFFIKSKLQLVLIALAEILPVQLFKPKIVKQELEDVIYNMTRSIQKERNFKPSGRNDIMDLILKMENEAQLNSPNDENANVDFVAAQLFSVLLGGFETTATSISYTLHQLAFHPEIQEKIQQEVDEVMSRYDGKLTYEGIGEMTYLEMAWKEAMRMFSPFGGISRICTKRYTIPGTDVTIDPGVRITLPSQALHMDPKHFEDPHEFRPERFALGVESKISYAYSVFGDGPRKCLGIRLAFVMSLAALVAVLHRYTVAPGPSTLYQPDHRNSPILAQNFEGDMPLLFIQRTGKN